jgi:hypothetical protein
MYYFAIILNELPDREHLVAVPMAVTKGCIYDSLVFAGISYEKREV